MIYVETYNEIVGFHRYPNAPEFCDYLESRHRHTFVIRCSFAVVHEERQIEINNMQQEIHLLLLRTFGYPCEFGDMSCESIASFILHKCSADKVTVLEDGYGGATFTR